MSMISVKITADRVSMSGFTLKNLPESICMTGIRLCASFCNISGNNCSNHVIGSYLDNSTDNIISGNDCSNNRWDGIGLYESSDNILYLNTFINNTDNVDSRSSANIWNSTSKMDYTYEGRTFANCLGNYWGDYEGNDSDNDGVGDSPYRIDCDRDNHPLMVPIENYLVETENVQEQKEV